MRLRWWWHDSDTAERVAIGYVGLVMLVLAAVVVVDLALAPREAPASAPKAVVATSAAPTPAQTPRETPRATRGKPRTPAATPKAAKPVQVRHRGTQRLKGIRGYAQSLVPASQWRCLDRLWRKESHWNPQLVGPLNPDGKYPVGIPQLKGLKVTDPPRYQVKRGLAYIKHRYGVPCKAWAHSRAEGWY